MSRSFLFFLFLVPIFACGDGSPRSNQGIAPSTLQIQKLSSLLERQADIQPGEKVILVAKPGRFSGLIDKLVRDLKATGAIHLGTISVQEFEPKWDNNFSKKARSLTGAQLVNHLSVVDLGIMMPGAISSDPVYAAHQQVLREGRGRSIHFHWAGAYDLHQNELPVDEEIDQFYQDAILHTDYMKLSRVQLQFEDAMRRDTVFVTTPAGTNLQFWIGDRPVTKQDGDASARRSNLARNLIDREIEIPAGAIRVAPVEATVNGDIFFPDALWGDTAVQDLKLTFKAGRVVDIKANHGQDAVKKVLDAAGDSGYSFREFALGFNPLLAIPESDAWIPYYGYGAGIIRLSLGDNTELGGIVGGGFVRWNFFTDATVLVGDRVWVQDGRLLRLP